MHFRKINETTSILEFSFNDLSLRGIDIHDIEDIHHLDPDQLMEVIVDEMEGQGELDTAGALNLKISANPFGLKAIVSVFDPNALPFDFDDDQGMPDFLREAVMNEYEKKKRAEKNDPEEENKSFVVVFDDFEDIIQMIQDVHLLNTIDVLSDLYVYKEKYHMFFDFKAYNHDDKLNLLSRFKEYGRLNNTTEHILNEYGKIIIKDEAIENLHLHFVAEL